MSAVLLLYIVMANTCPQQPSVRDIDGFQPANISVSRTQVFVGDSLEITCITALRNPSSKFCMYLCKNGSGFRMAMVKHTGEVRFKLDSLTTQDSGLYSCVASAQKMSPTKVTSTCINAVYIRVDVSQLRKLILYSLAFLIDLVVLLTLIGLCYHKKWLNRGRQDDLKDSQQHEIIYTELVGLKEDKNRYHVNHDTRVIYTSIKVRGSRTRSRNSKADLWISPH
ncbi:uncharacterized protein LOC134438752 isoform X2 [Engraulis encrasicolus]|uniref:uncharacterized protein LOC134438752 isoform X2 n=1 Tax=Engraulis encrasicolus TaxID=184585 RepID=UPI002FD51E00